MRNPARVRPQLNRLAELAGDVPVIVAGASPNSELIAAYAEAGAAARRPLRLLGIT